MAGTLAIEISGTDPAATYSLEKSHEVVAGVGDPSQFFELVFQHAFALVGSATAGLQSKTPDALSDHGKQVAQATGAVKERLVGWLGHRDAIGTGLAAALSAQGQVPPQDPAALFRLHVNAATRTFVKIEALKAPRSFGFGASAQHPPPVRVQAWDKARELAYLEAQGVATEAIVGHAEAYCAPDSFGPAPGEALGQRITGGKPWKTYVTTNKVEPGALARALGFADLGHLRAVVTGKAPAGITDHLSAALAAQAPTADQRELLFAQQMANLHDELDTCRHNIGLLREAADASPALVKRLTSLQASIDDFDSQVESAAQLFRDDLAPFLIAAVVDVVQGTASGDVVTFGPFPIESGETQLAIKRTDQAGEHPLTSLVANGDQPVLGLGFSMGVGFAFSACKQCNSEVIERIVPSADGSTSTRAFVEQRRSVAFEPIVTGQLDLVSSKLLSLGLVLGVPLGDVRGRSDAVMLGVGVRIRNIMDIAAGVESFLTRDLPGPDGGDERVELKTAADQTLTADQVSRLEPRYSFVLAITFARNLL
ncbi:MAG TPA: hypothetical protein VFT22_11765 [Kofleriaceae bacterium]|nr:hypothetical protein [Kofleriaceae bacterium]